MITAGQMFLVENKNAFFEFLKKLLVIFYLCTLDPFEHNIFKYDMKPSAAENFMSFITVLQFVIHKSHFVQALTIK